MADVPQGHPAAAVAGHRLQHRHGADRAHPGLRDPLAFANSGGVTTGNPLGYENSLGTFVTYLYVKGFVYQDMGYASALAFIMFAATLVLTGLVLWLARHFTAYGDADQN